LTFGLGVIILQGVSRRKSLAGVNIMPWHFTTLRIRDFIPSHTKAPGELGRLKKYEQGYLLILGTWEDSILQKEKNTTNFSVCHCSEEDLNNMLYNPEV
jgi:hypothetical protein